MKMKSVQKKANIQRHVSVLTMLLEVLNLVVLEYVPSDFSSSLSQYIALFYLSV